MSDDKRLERIEEKLDKVVEHIGSIDITLATQHVSLAEHIKRTAMLEEQIIPINKHVNMVKGAIALLTILATIAGIVSLFK